MCCYYTVVLENYVFHTDATGHIAVILEMYAPEGSPYFVAVTLVAMLEMDIKTDRLYSK
jgi:hypothetical protein